jgi:glycine hydroxymethyltransferase
LAASLQEQGYRVISGGTDSHVMLIDVFAKGVKGKEAEKALDEAYITANKNAIPFDTNPPLNPSGIRLGSPAVTTRGFRETEMKEVGRLIAGVLNDVKSEQGQAQARRGVAELTRKFPLYAWKRQAVSAH